ncbi:MAG TPA: SDR family oxidoreductase [Rhizomicrobium sp.]|jgi:3-oxoacyl-[acyl-carrier protein] reductase
MATRASYDFREKTVLITGGGEGIGLGIANAFAMAGAHVIVAARREEPLRAFCDAFPANSSYLKLDVSSSTERLAAVKEIRSRHGKLDVLVNNALSYSRKPFLEMTESELAEPFNVMVIGAAALSQQCFPLLQAARGSVLNISATSSIYVNYPTWRLTVYAAAKAALNQLTRGMAAEWGPAGVRVNAILPGVTVTRHIDPTDEEFVKSINDITPLGRIGLPEDIAELALFLSSDSASWITGELVRSSGGFQLTG